MGNVSGAPRVKVDAVIRYYSPVPGDAPYTVVKQTIWHDDDSVAVGPAEEKANELRRIATQLAEADTSEALPSEAGGPLPWMPCLVEQSPCVSLFAKSPPSAPVTDIDIKRSMFWLRKALGTDSGPIPLKDNAGVVRVFFDDEPV